MDKYEQVRKFNDNLIMPILGGYISLLPIDFTILWFTLHPIDSWDSECKSVVRLQRAGSGVASSHTLALYIYTIIELDCITFLFAKLLLPNIVNDRERRHEIQLPHLSIRIYKILQLSKLLTMKEDFYFYEKYKDELGVDLEKGHSEK